MHLAKLRTTYLGETFNNIQLLTRYRVIFQHLNIFRKRYLSYKIFLNCRPFTLHSFKYFKRNVTKELANTHRPRRQKTLAMAYAT